LKIEFEPTRADWQEADWLNRRLHKGRPNPFKILRIAGLAAAALGALLLVKRPDGGGWVGPVLLIGFGLFVPLRLLAIAHAQAEEAWSNSDRLLQPAAWEFGDHFIQVTSPLWNVQYTWAAFVNWREGATVILLYQTVDQFQVIPKRAFADAELLEFRRLLDGKIVRRLHAFPVLPASAK
jgi:hypothetical protein